MSKSASTPSSPQHIHCYLLRSLNPKNPNSTYVGFTTNPSQRIRRHNGEIKGGAKRTERRGRPWEMCAVVHGFETKKHALKFEWAWQNTWKSFVVEPIIGEARRSLRRKYSPYVKLKCMYLLLNSPDWSSQTNLTVHFPRADLRDMTKDKRFRNLFPKFSELPTGIGAEVLPLKDQPHSYEDIMGDDDDEEDFSDNETDSDDNSEDDDDDNDDDEEERKSTPQKRKAVETGNDTGDDDVVDLTSPASPASPASPTPNPAPTTIPTPTPPPLSKPREVISISSSVTSSNRNTPHSIISISSTENESRMSGPPSTGSIDRRFSELLGGEVSVRGGNGAGRKLEMEGEI